MKLRPLRPLLNGLIPLLLLLPALPACGDDVPEEEPAVEIDVTTVAEEQEPSGTGGDPDDGAPDPVVADGTVDADDGGAAQKAGRSALPRATASTGRTPRPATASRGEADQNRESADSYDPAVWDALLKKYVQNGRVDYAGFRGDARFSPFVASLAAADPAAMSTDEALAFWVNAYNALVIRNVLDHPRITNPLDVPGFFDKITFRVAGRTLTLNDIENSVIRPTYDEPLIHFGLVCAARSCPPLIPSAYTGSNVRTKLAENARAYLADTRQNRFEESSGTLWVSKIFEWYRVDFGDSDAGIIAFVRAHGPEDLRRRIAAADNLTVKYNEYDWTLNGK